MSPRRLWVVLCLSCVFTVAQADESGGWRAAYREGTRQFDVGEYRAALDAFKRAYVAHEEAGILFDIGECHRHLGESAEAVHAYRGYLRKKPDAANRSEVEALIAQLDGASTSTPAPKPGPPRTAPAPATTAPAPATTAPPPSPAPAPAAAPAAEPPHGSVYDPWGRGGSAPAPAAPAPTASAPAPTAPAAPAAAPTAAVAAPSSAPSPEAAPVAAAATTPPPAWAASTTREAEPPPHRSKAWIAAIVVPAAVVLAVSIGVTAWYLEPSPTYTRLGAAQ